MAVGPANSASVRAPLSADRHCRTDYEPTATWIASWRRVMTCFAASTRSAAVSWRRPAACASRDCANRAESAHGRQRSAAAPTIEAQHERRCRRWRHLHALVSSAEPARAPRTHANRAGMALALALGRCWCWCRTPAAPP
jgi:hypothetical protein